MNEVIVFPDVETLLVDYLGDQFATYSDYTSPTLVAYTKVPNPRPARFVLLIRTGGTNDTIVSDRPTITVESWSNSAVEAAEIAQLVRGLIHAVDQVDGVQFYRVQEFAGPANLPDPISGQERYTQTFSVGVRGAAL